MKWVTLCLAMALPASAEKPRIAVVPFTGKASTSRSHLAAALCKQAKCVPPDSVLTAQHQPDWAKIAINGVSGVVSGRLVKSHHKQEWELSVVVSAQQPAWTTTVPAETLSPKAQAKVVKEILAHLAGGEPGEMPAPAQLREESPPPPEPATEAPGASAPPPATSAPEPVPSETPEERAARATAADQAFAAGGKGKKRDEAPKVATAPKAEQPPAAKPKPAPKAPEPETAPPPSTSRGNYKPLPAELLSSTPRI